MHLNMSKEGRSHGKCSYHTHPKNFGGDEYVCCLDCGDGFVGTRVQTHQIVKLNMCSTLYISSTHQKDVFVEKYDGKLKGFSLKKKKCSLLGRWSGILRVTSEGSHGRVIVLLWWQPQCHLWSRWQQDDSIALALLPEHRMWVRRGLSPRFPREPYVWCVVRDGLLPSSVSGHILTSVLTVPHAVDGEAEGWVSTRTTYSRGPAWWGVDFLPPSHPSPPCPGILANITEKKKSKNDGLKIFVSLAFFPFFLHIFKPIPS